MSGRLAPPGRLVVFAMRQAEAMVEARPDLAGFMAARGCDCFDAAVGWEDWDVLLGLHRSRSARAGSPAVARRREGNRQRNRAARAARRRQR